MRVQHLYSEDPEQRRRALFLWNSTGIIGSSNPRVLYGRLTEAGVFRALESFDIRLLEYTAPYVAPIVGGRIGIDFTIGTSALA